MHELVNISTSKSDEDESGMNTIREPAFCRLAYSYLRSDGTAATGRELRVRSYLTRVCGHYNDKRGTLV